MVRQVSCRYFTSIPKFGEKLRKEFVQRAEQSYSFCHVRSTVEESPKEGNSAVLVPLLNIESKPWILFTQRSRFLSRHPGQVCFPGGRLDAAEEPEEGALRESEEEVGLDSREVKIWGRLPPIYTRNLMNIVTPVVGMLRDVSLKKLYPRDAEVRTVFAVPVEELCSSNGYTHFKKPDANYYMPVFTSRQYQMLSGDITDDDPHFLKPKVYRIWGLSAAILHLALLNLFPSLYKSDINLRLPPVPK